LGFFGFLALAYKPKAPKFWLPKYKSQKSTYLGAFWLLSKSQKAKKPKQTPLEERENEREVEWTLMQEATLARAPRHFMKVKGGHALIK
jgi:hypothetical protein